MCVFCSVTGQKLKYSNLKLYVFFCHNVYRGLCIDCWGTGMFRHAEACGQLTRLIYYPVITGSTLTIAIAMCVIAMSSKPCWMTEKLLHNTNYSDIYLLQGFLLTECYLFFVSSLTVLNYNYSVSKLNVNKIIVTLQTVNMKI